MFSDRLKRYGIKGFLLNAFSKSFRLFGIKLDFLIVYEIRAKAVSPNPNTIKFHRLTFEEIKKQERLNSSWFTSEKVEAIRHAFKIEGNTAYGAFDNDLLICYGWVSMKQWAFEERNLLPGDGYLWDDYTHPNYRGRGLHKQSILHRIGVVYALGGHRVLAQASNFNRASRVGFERLGFKTIDSYMTYKIGNNKEKSTIKYGQK